VEEALPFVQRELRSPEGGFFSSLDADSEGEEGGFYTWTPAGLQVALGADAAAVAGAFDVTEAGNFDGRNVLHPVTPEATAVLDAVRDRLTAARARRVRPHRDEKVIAGWNGLMLRAFAEAGRVLDRRDLVSTAETTAQFLLSRMRSGDRILRSYKDGRATLAGYLEDQAAVADGLLSLYEATFDAGWLDQLRRLVNEMLSAFWDESRTAFFDTAADQEQLVVRPQDVTDSAIPSGTSMAIDVMRRAGTLLGEEGWIRTARSTLERLAPTAAKAPEAFGRLLAALDFELGRPVELAVIGPRVDVSERAQLGINPAEFRRVDVAHVGPSQKILHAALAGLEHPLDAPREGPIVDRAEALGLGPETWYNRLNASGQTAQERAQPRLHIREIAGDYPDQWVMGLQQPGLHTGQRTHARIAIADLPHAIQGRGGPTAGDDGLIDHRRQPMHQVLDQRAIARG